MEDTIEVIKVYTEEEGGELLEFGTNKAYKLKAVIVNGQVVKAYDGVYIEKHAMSQELANQYLNQNL